MLSSVIRYYFSNALIINYRNTCIYIFLGNDFENIAFSVYSISIEFIWGKLSAVGTVMITTNIIVDAL